MFNQSLTNEGGVATTRTLSSAVVFCIVYPPELESRVKPCRQCRPPSTQTLPLSITSHPPPIRMRRFTTTTAAPFERALCVGVLSFSFMLGGALGNPAMFFLLCFLHSDATSRRRRRCFISVIQRFIFHSLVSFCRSSLSTAVSRRPIIRGFWFLCW